MFILKISKECKESTNNSQCHEFKCRCRCECFVGRRYVSTFVSAENL